MMVLMFHSVGCNGFNWSRKHLSVSLKNFQRFCKYLHENNYKTIWLDEWYENYNNITEDQTVVLTYDDGYLDNWVYVFPILKKYELKATIFINPEFVDTVNEDPRPQFISPEFDISRENQILGFLNWNEIREMDRSEVFDVQNHTMSHNRYFSSPEIIDFLNPGNADHYDWMMWPEYPSLKPSYMFHRVLDHLKAGQPIYKNDRGLAIRRYYPDEELNRIAVDKYDSLKKKGSYTESEIKDILHNEMNLLKSTGKYSGKYETDEEMRIRYEYEIKKSKTILENKLNKKIRFLSWPGGGFNKESLNIAISLNYLASTISSRHTGEKELFIDPYRGILRKGMGDKFLTRKGWKNSFSGNILVLRLKALQNNKLSKLNIKFQEALFQLISLF